MMDNVALLEKSLYGARGAAANFQAEVKKVMRDNGFKVGRYNVSTSCHPGKGLRTMVHGDDFVTTGGREAMRWLRERLEARFEIKTKVVGLGTGESREETVLSRVIRVTERGWEYEPDQRHGSS